MWPVILSIEEEVGADYRHAHCHCQQNQENCKKNNKLRGRFLMWGSYLAAWIHTHNKFCRPRTTWRWSTSLWRWTRRAAPRPPPRSPRAPWTISSPELVWALRWSWDRDTQLVWKFYCHKNLELFIRRPYSRHSPRGLRLRLLLLFERSGRKNKLYQIY